MLKTALAALALVCLASTAEACIPTGDVMRPCAYEADFLAGVKSIRVSMHRERRAESGAIVAHPSGCPRRAFCGCGAAVHVFGQPIRELWLAANWFRFPRAAPGAGMVAVRRHHVFVLEADLGGGVWRVYDANSGRHVTRIHARSIAGFTVVNPHGASS
jgi:hypothetical protein